MRSFNNARQLSAAAAELQRAESIAAEIGAVLARTRAILAQVRVAQHGTAGGDDAAPEEARALLRVSIDNAP